LKTFLLDWRNLLPVAGLAALAVVGVVLWFRRKPADAGEVERQRRAYLNRVGRIVEGQVLEIADQNHAGALSKSDAQNGTKSETKTDSAFLAGNPANDGPNDSQKLLYYTYAISGVTYETAQDVTGLEEWLHLTRVAVGQIASVKYDPSNPSNSILLADGWSGLH